MLRFVRFYRNPYITKLKNPWFGKKMTTSPKISNKFENPVVWIDCEMTGLDHTKDHIIEVCCVLTDGKFEVIQDPATKTDACFESVIHYDRSVLDNMNEWCIDQHGKSGLTEKVLTSCNTLENVQSDLLKFIKKHIPEKNTAVLAGNSVHVDRLFLLNEFPDVVDHLFYRIIDVSSIMEVCKRHNPRLQMNAPKKTAKHTAKSDIFESIEQLKWYINNYFVSPAKQDGIPSKTPQDCKKRKMP